MTPHPEPGILLASASPRRRRLLHLLGMDFEVTSVDVPEDPLGADEVPHALAARLAAEKATVARAVTEKRRIVIGCDTVVVHGGRALGKPADLDDALDMLRSLSGKEHDVVTGFAVLAPGAEAPLVDTVVSRVSMRTLTEETTREWVDRGELLGCAGAYNIEGHLADVRPTQCYQNVAGLPLCHLYVVLAPLAPGVEPPVAACDAARGTRCLLGPQVIREAQSL